MKRYAISVKYESALATRVAVVTLYAPDLESAKREACQYVDENKGEVVAVVSANEPGRVP